MKYSFNIESFLKQCLKNKAKLYSLYLSDNYTKLNLILPVNLFVNYYIPYDIVTRLNIY